MTHPKPNMPDYFEAEYSMDMFIAGPQASGLSGQWADYGGGAGLLSCLTSGGD